MRVVAVMVLVGCYAPAPKAGSPCVTDHDCPRRYVCSPATSSCEDTAAEPDAAELIDAPLIDGCTPSREICGNGIDEDCEGTDPACAANDVAAGAIDVTAGGTFTGNALLARDDIGANGCGLDGGRDLFFQVDQAAAQVYYFDTFGSNYNTVIRVYAKPCTQVGTGANAAACSDDACGGAQGQVAISLPAGRSCIVIDQKSEADPNGMMMLRVIKGGRNAMPLAAGTQSINGGDTCMSTNSIEPVDNAMCDGPGSGGKDHAYFFTTCPNQTLKLDADICPEPSWDPVLHVRRQSDNMQIGCNDDSCGAGPRITNVNITGGLLYYLFVDGFDPTFCGTYQLHTNLRP
jgi:hypothetical protein